MNDYNKNHPHSILGNKKLNLKSKILLNLITLFSVAKLGYLQIFHNMDENNYFLIFIAFIGIFIISLIIYSIYTYLIKIFLKSINIRWIKLFLMYLFIFSPAFIYATAMLEQRKLFHSKSVFELFCLFVIYLIPFISLYTGNLLIGKKAGLEENILAFTNLSYLKNKFSTSEGLRRLFFITSLIAPIFLSFVPSNFKFFYRYDPFLNLLEIWSRTFPYFLFFYFTLHLILWTILWIREGFLK